MQVTGYKIVLCFNNNVSQFSRLSQLVMEKVQEKISGLEQENKELRRSMEKCFSETEKLESWEKALMDDLFCLLRQSSSEVKQLRDELSNKKAALHKTQTDKANILAELVDLHRNYNSVSAGGRCFVFWSIGPKEIFSFVSKNARHQRSVMSSWKVAMTALEYKLLINVSLKLIGLL